MKLSLEYLSILIILIYISCNPQEKPQVQLDGQPDSWTKLKRLAFGQLMMIPDHIFRAFTLKRK